MQRNELRKLKLQAVEEDIQSQSDGDKVIHRWTRASHEKVMEMDPFAKAQPKSFDHVKEVWETLNEADYKPLFERIETE